MSNSEPTLSIVAPCYNEEGNVPILYERIRQVMETIDRVKKTVAEKQPYWPEHLTITYSQDNSKVIRDMLLDLVA